MSFTNLTAAFALIAYVSVANSATPFTDLKCQSTDKVYSVMVLTDEGAAQQVTITRSKGTDVRQLNYMNYDKNEVLTQVGVFSRGIYAVALGKAGEDHSVASLFQLGAIPGTIKIKEKQPMKATFDAVIPAFSTLMPDGKGANENAIDLKCSIELIQ